MQGCLKFFLFLFAFLFIFYLTVLGLGFYGIPLAIMGAVLAYYSSNYRNWLSSQPGYSRRLANLPGLRTTSATGLAIATLAYLLPLSLVSLLLSSGTFSNAESIPTSACVGLIGIILLYGWLIQGWRLSSAKTDVTASQEIEQSTRPLGLPLRAILSDLANPVAASVMAFAFLLPICFWGGVFTFNEPLQEVGLLPTYTPIPTHTPTSAPTPTARPTFTPLPSTNTPKPKPTNTPKPTATQANTPVPTEEPTTKAAESPISPEVAEYLIEVGERVGNIGNALDEMSTLTQNADAGNDDWVLATATQLAAIQFEHFQLTILEPPPAMSEVHAAIVDATSDCDKMTDSFAEGVDNADPGKIEEADTLLKSCTKKLNDAKALIESSFALESTAPTATTVDDNIPGVEAPAEAATPSATPESVSVPTSTLTPAAVSSCPNPGVQITSPAPGFRFNSRIIVISGNANIPNFASYKIEYSTDPNSGVWNYLLERNTPIDNGPLMELDTSTVPSGPYGVRLTVIDLSGNYPEPCIVWFNDSNAPATVNTPASTDSDQGPCSCEGDFYNCGDFGSHQSAQACFNYCVANGSGDIHRLDQDNDGDACESLR